MSFTQVTITGTFKRSDGTPASGLITATLSQAMHNGTTSVSPGLITGTIGGGRLIAPSGGPLVLLANDDPATAPEGTSYDFAIELDDASSQSFSAVVPHAASGGTIDVTELAPVIPVTPETEAYATKAELTTKIIDLGLIDFAAVFSGGPQVLYEMQEGEYLRAVKWTDLGWVEPTPAWYVPFLKAAPGVGTRKSFGWYAFASTVDTDGSGYEYLGDTDTLIAGDFGYGPDLGDLQQMLVLSAAAGGPVEAAYFIAGEDPIRPRGEGNGVRLAGVTAWAAKTAYQLERGQHRWPHDASAHSDRGQRHRLVQLGRSGHVR